MEGQEPCTYHARLDASGRIVLPAEVRQRHHWSEGDAVIVVDDGRDVVVKSFSQVVKEAQEYFQAVIPKGVSLVDELIAERRADAARE
jgi:AbrB family transcriptional regulator, stage V sporulation protein T